MQLTDRAGVLVNAGLVFFTFLTSLAGIFLKLKRLWLKIYSGLVLACAMLTLILGLLIWFSTLKTRANMGTVWSQQPPNVQDLLQQKVSRYRCHHSNRLP